MFTVKNRLNGDTVHGRFFTNWEAQELVDRLNETVRTATYYVEEK